MNFDCLKKIREKALLIINSLDIDKLNTIPEPFKNNVTWNFVHSLVTQQILYYKLADVPMLIDHQFVDQFKKGTEANEAYNPYIVDTFKEFAITSLEQTEDDYKLGKFKSYKPYQTSFGVKLSNIEEAHHFNQVHESVHLGYIMALRKLVY